jgi:hypothetical protein
MMVMNVLWIDATVKRVVNTSLLTLETILLVQIGNLLTVVAMLTAMMKTPVPTTNV